MSLLGKRRSKIKSDDEILEERIKQQEKAYIKGEEPKKKEFVCGFCGEPFETHQKLSWHIRIEHKDEKQPQEGVEKVDERLGEEPTAGEPSLEEVVYGLSGQAALLTNLKRFELTDAEAESIDTGVELITNTVWMYLNKIGGREEK